MSCTIRNPDCFSPHHPSIKILPSIVRKCRFQWTCSCLVLDIKMWRPWVTLYFEFVTILANCVHFSLPASLHLWSDLLLSSIQRGSDRRRHQICSRIWRNYRKSHHAGSRYACPCIPRLGRFPIISHGMDLSFFFRIADGIIPRQFLCSFD